MAGADDNARELAKREGKAFGAKDSLDTLHQELALNFYPERADFLGDRTLGEEFAFDIFDDEPLRCRRDLADARGSMLRADGQEWVKVETSDDEVNERPQVARALDYTNKLFLAFLEDFRTGFRKATKEGDNDVVTFGYQVLSSESEMGRDGKRVPVIRCWHPRDCAFHMDITGIKPDVMFRRLMLPARHIRTKFPKADLHDNIKQALDEDPDKEFRLCHVMMPAVEYDHYEKPRGSKKSMPWVSIYYDSDHQTMLREEASARFRYVVDRWMTIPGSQYGYSPAAMTSLPGARGMQTMAQVLLEAGEKSLDPPLKLTDGAVKGDLDMRAGGLTWVDKNYDERMGPAVEPLLPSDRNIPIGIDLILRATQAMRDGFYLSKLRLPGQTKTAFETQALLEQFIRENIPLFSPWEAGLTMILEEVWETALELRIFGPALGELLPEMFRDGKSFVFKNPLRDAIERNRINQMNQILPLVAGAAQFDPAAPKRVDVVKMLEDSVRGVGAPADWLADEDAAAEAMAQQNQAQQFLGAINTAGQIAEVAKTGTEAAANLQMLQGEPADQSYVRGPT